MNRLTAEKVYRMLDTTVPDLDRTSGHEINLCFGPSLFSLSKEQISQVAKKSIVYARRSFLLSPYESHRIELRSPFYESESGIFPSEYNIADELQELVSYLRVPMQLGFISIVPMKTSVRVAGNPLLDSIESASTTNYLRLRDNSNVLQVSLKSDILRSQILEEMKAVRLFLPHLKGIDISDIFKVRNDYQPSFEQFQEALCNFRDFNYEQGDSELFHLLQHVDENISRINENMAKIQKEQWFSRAKGVLGTMSFVLELLVPIEMVGVIEKAIGYLGTKSLIDFFDGEIHARNRQKELEKDAFFVPWKVSN